MKKTESRYYQPSAINSYEKSSKQDGTSAVDTAQATARQVPKLEDKHRGSQGESEIKSVDLSQKDRLNGRRLHQNQNESPDGRGSRISDPYELLFATKEDIQKLNEAASKSPKTPLPQLDQVDERGRHGQKHTKDKTDQKVQNHYYDDEYVNSPQYQSNLNMLYGGADQHPQYQAQYYTPQQVSNQQMYTNSDMNQRAILEQEQSEMPFSVAQQQTSPEQLAQTHAGAPRMVSQSTQWSPEDINLSKNAAKAPSKNSMARLENSIGGGTNQNILPTIGRAETIVGLQAIGRGDTIAKIDYHDHSGLNQSNPMLRNSQFSTTGPYKSTATSTLQGTLGNNNLKNQLVDPQTNFAPSGELQTFRPNSGTELDLARQMQSDQSKKIKQKSKLARRDLEAEQEEDYVMISDLFDINVLCEAEEYGIKRTKNTLYRGTLIERRRQGLGVLVYDNGRVYEGEWQDDARNGRGFELFNNQATYLGQYLNNKIHGKGTYTWPNGEIYDGEWNNGIKEGFGIWKGINGESYIGEWKDGKVNGYGVDQWKNGDRYEGEWKDSLKHGKGTDAFANGDTYVGEYSYGKPNGFGTYKWKNGASYVGNFANGVKDGAGKWKKDAHPNSNQYEGNFFNDMKHGHGAFTWESGNKYEGDYWMDLREGFGRMQWYDGSSYEGEWHKGLQNGQGRLVLPDGRVKEGLFRNNKFQGVAARLPLHSQVSTIQEEDEHEQSLREGAKSDYIPPHNRQRSVKPIGQGYAKKVRALAPPIRPMSPLNPNEKKQSKGHDLERQQNEYDRMNYKIKVDHVIDLDDEPHHSELLSDNREYAVAQLNRNRETSDKCLQAGDPQLDKGTSTDDAVSLHLEKYMDREQQDSDEEEVVLKHIPTKPVTKRAPKAREFNEVQNRKIDVSNARSKVDTGSRRHTLTRPRRKVKRQASSSLLNSDLAPSTTRPSGKQPLRKKVSPHGKKLNDASTINSIDETMSKLSPKTLKKKKKGTKDQQQQVQQKSRGRKSPYLQSNNVDVVDEGSDDSFESESIGTTKQPPANALLQDNEVNLDQNTPQKMRRSQTIKYPKAKESAKNEDKIMDDSRSAIKADQQSQHITQTMEGLDMNVDLTPEMQRKPSAQVAPSSKQLPASASKKEKAKGSRDHAKQRSSSRKIIEKIDSNFQISKQESGEKSRLSNRTEEQNWRPSGLDDQQRSMQYDNQSPKGSSPQYQFANNTSEVIAQVPSVLHEGGALEHTTIVPPALNLTKNSNSEYGTENYHPRRATATQRKNKPKEYIELEDYAPVTDKQSEQQAPLPKKKKKKSPQARSKPVTIDSADAYSEDQHQRSASRKDENTFKNLQDSSRRTLGVRGSVQPDIKKHLQDALMDPIEERKVKKRNRKFTSDSLQIPDGALKRISMMTKDKKPTEYEQSVLSNSPRLLSGKPRKLRRDGSEQLMEQQRRQQKQKEINARHDSPSLQVPHDTPQNDKKYGIKLPKLVNSPFNNRVETSQMSLNDGMESSILSHKRRAVPKRKRSKESPSTAMGRAKGPGNQPDYMSRRLSGISDQMDVEIDQALNSKSKKTARRNLLPRLNQSVIVPSSTQPGTNSKLSSPLDTPTNKPNSRNRMMRSAAKAKPKRPAAIKDDESNLSSSLLRKLATDSEQEKKKRAGKYGGFDSNEDLDEIKEQRLASRKAIELLMQGIKKQQNKLKVWVPNGLQSEIHHTNFRHHSPKPQKARF